MGKVSARNEFDWVMVSVRFGDGTEAKVKWNRGGADVSVTPRDPSLSKALSIVVQQAEKLPGITIGKIAETMSAVGERAASAQDYVEGLKSTLGVSGEAPKLAGGPASAKVELGKSRGGHVVSGTFPSGETFELKINRASVGLSTSPRIASRDNDLMNFVFSVKNSGLVDDGELAQRALETAEGSEDMDSWVESLRASMAPAPRR